MSDSEKNTNEDAMLPTAHHSVKLPSFEGPLDLLLFLIRKNEVDIYDIPIERVTRQYLDYIYSCDRMDLELTGDFFVMAATLMVIKSRMLLPKQEQAPEEEEELDESDPRWELVQQLIQYKKIKEEAEQLELLIANQYDLLPRNVDESKIEKAPRPLKDSNRMELWNAFNKVLQRLSDRIVTGEIQDEQHSVADRMSYIIERVKVEDTFYLSSLVPEKTSINLLVTTFLALLEVCRMKVIFLEQTDNFEDILCTKRGDGEEQMFDLEDYGSEE